MEWIEPATGEIHTAQIFVGALGASQFTFVEATATQRIKSKCCCKNPFSNLAI